MSNVKGTTVKPTQALNLDINQQKIFIKYYESLGVKPKTTIRFFDRSDYFSLHGDDAHLAAKSIFKSESTIKTMAPPDSGTLDYICLSKGNFEIFLRELLLVKNFRVEVYTNKQTNDWTVEFRGSPGNLIQFDSILFAGNEQMTIGTAIIGLNLKFDGQIKHVGVSCIESNERTISILEFDDDDFFTELEALVVLLGPKECILPRTDGVEFERIQTLLERNGVLITLPSKRTDFTLDQSDLVQDLNRLLHFKNGQQESAYTVPELLSSKSIAMSALAATLKYLDLINDSCNLGHYEIKMLNLNRFVHLDAAAVSALNLLPKPGTNINSPAYKWQSILGVLDRCHTAQGHRLMAQWVKQPLCNADTINDRLDIVQCLVDASNVRSELNDTFFKKVPDIMALSKKLMRKKATLQDIYRLYQVIVRIPKLITILSQCCNKTIDSVLVEPMKDTFVDLKLLKQMVEQVIDKDGLEKGDYFVKPSFDEQLAELKENMDKLEEKINGQLRKAISDLQFDSIKLDYVSHLGYHFRITLKDESIIRKNNKYKLLDAIKGGARFTTDRLNELNQEFLHAKNEYEEQQKTIVDGVIRVAIGYLGPLSSLNNQLAQLDCLLSFAVVAVSAPVPYVKPKILPKGSGVLNMTGLRHPCLELQEDVTYIANDVAFKKDEIQMYIITGPNMGGKSTYIRSVGAAVLMAHIGSFVPCTEATISIVDSILGRIGADDNINKGLSTFMVEMIETAGIIRTATSDSLVVIDELGRGTSTYEGCGIAWSIAEHLAKETKCFTLFATHFHEITELATYVPTVKNAHIVAITDNGEFTLLYQLRPGVMDKSFGIHVAKIANFPEDVVNFAQKLYDECEDHFGKLKSSTDVEIDGKNLEKEFMNIVDKFLTTNSDVLLINDKDINSLTTAVCEIAKQYNISYNIK